MKNKTTEGHKRFSNAEQIRYSRHLAGKIDISRRTFSTSFSRSTCARKSGEGNFAIDSGTGLQLGMKVERVRPAGPRHDGNAARFSLLADTPLSIAFR